jgi:hypothetical protein
MLWKMPEAPRIVLLDRKEDVMTRKKRKRIVKEMLLWRRIVTTNSHFGMSRFRAIGVEERKPEHFMELLE